MHDAETDDGRMLTVIDEVEVEQEHFVTSGGFTTHTDAYIPPRADAVPESVAEMVWEQFNIALDGPEYDLEILEGE